MSQATGAKSEMKNRPLIIKLKAVATGLIAHLGDGQCPDGSNGFMGRDPDCEACQIIEEATAAEAGTEDGEAKN